MSKRIMSKTYCIVSGCSFTDPFFKSTIYPDYDCNFPKWPEMIDGNWDEIINVSKSGYANQRILDRALERVLLDKNVSTCIVALTNWLRFTGPDYLTVNLERSIDENFEIPDHLRKHYEKTRALEKLYPTTEKILELRVNDTMLKLYNLAQICIHKDIKFIAFQMLPHVAGGVYTHKPLGGYNGLKEMCSKHMLNNQFFKHLNRLNMLNKVDLVNWPFINKLKKCASREMNDEYYGDPLQVIVGENDSHPNAKGHQWLAAWVMTNSNFLSNTRFL